jgi:hypothetical protein
MRPSHLIGAQSRRPSGGYLIHSKPTWCPPSPRTGGVRSSGRSG